MLIIEGQTEPIALMLNGDTSSLIVNNHQVRVYLGRFTIKGERSFLPYHFIDEGIHEDMTHTVLIFVTEKTGHGRSVECFFLFAHNALRFNAAKEKKACAELRHRLEIMIASICFI